ncbi:MAG: hypothetical protein MZV70_36870 [Desulfobacterales bacterium]|nr:hypothetical protein [Desulfobacterales bacterium]
MAMTGGFALNLAAPGTAQAALKKMPTKWDETWDVVIVGSGFAGLGRGGGSGRRRFQGGRFRKNADLRRQLDHQRRCLGSVGQQISLPPEAQSG